jgi:hypothetical protein
MKEAHVLNFRIDGKTDENLGRLAGAYGLNKSSFIRFLINSAAIGQGNGPIARGSSSIVSPPIAPGKEDSTDDASRKEGINTNSTQSTPAAPRWVSTLPGLSEESSDDDTVKEAP